ncbi:MAG: GTP-dependent dephospho-CoA kinase family protein [Methanomassiliicoccaceae archaeon]|nr:GTP-dependent dephospho-CoA kinase family protein [Methanomassiliicoccaceae archaeon]
MSGPERSRRVPDEKRELFKEPFGSLITENDLKKMNGKIITVGDVVSLIVNRHGIIPDISVYDGMTERRETTEFSDLVKNEGRITDEVVNPAGMITAELVNAVRNALSGTEKRTIRVIGEEDLATLPCIILSPVGTNVIYGWPGKGMMLIITDESVRKRAEQLLNEMEEIP